MSDASPIQNGTAKYHLCVCPKYRRQTSTGLTEQMGGILRDLCQQQGVEIVEDMRCHNHIHLYLSIH